MSKLVRCCLRLRSERDMQACVWQLRRGSPTCSGHRHSAMLSSSCQDAPPPTCCRRGRSPTVLEGLRRRISSLFLSYIEAPEFNSEARRLKVVGPGQQQQFKYGQAGRATARAAQA